MDVYTMKLVMVLHVVYGSFPGCTPYYNIGQVMWPYERLKCERPLQSPIDLVTSKAVTLPLPRLEVVWPNLKGHRATLYNSGQTVYVYMNDDKPKCRPRLQGGPMLNDTFIFEQMHFHWGDEDVWGSEHLIDGESFAFEAHLVHWNSKYANAKAAANQDDGLVVLTIFAETAEKNNSLLHHLCKRLPDVSDPKSSVTMSSNEAMQWVISALNNNNDYYTYPGSLTTEPYSENVVFILLPKPIYLSCTQLLAFRTIHNRGGVECVTDNKRNLQPLHNRPIVHSINV